MEQCLPESHGIPYLLIQNASLHRANRQMNWGVILIKYEHYFNEIQLRFDHQSSEAQQIFVQSAIIEGSFDLDTVKSIVVLHTNRSNYWLLDALEELCGVPSSLCTNKIFIPPYFEDFQRFLTTELRLNLQLHHAQYFAQYAFIPYANHDFDIDAFMKKRNDIEKDIHVALENALYNNWKSLAANLGFALESICIDKDHFQRDCSSGKNFILASCNREQANCYLC